jgi:hypothetical protein
MVGVAPGAVAIGQRVKVEFATFETSDGGDITLPQFRPLAAVQALNGIRAMDFHLNDDQQAFADSARSLFTDYCSDDALRAHDAGAAPYMQALWAQCVATGLHSIVVDEAAGGLGQGMTELMAVLEPQGRALALVPLAEHQLAADRGGALCTRRCGRRAAPAGVRRSAGHAGAGRPEHGPRPAPAGAAPGRGLRGWTVSVAGRAAGGTVGAGAAAGVVPEGQPRLVAANPQDGRRRQACRRLTASATLRWPTCSFDGLHVDEADLLAAEALAWLEPRAIAALAALQLGCLGRAGGAHGRIRQPAQAVRSRDRQLPARAGQPGRRADRRRGPALGAVRSWCTGSMPACLRCRRRWRSRCWPRAPRISSATRHSTCMGAWAWISPTRSTATSTGAGRWRPRSAASAATLERLGDWLANNDTLGWKYDLAEHPETLRIDAVRPGETLPALPIPITVALVAGGAIATRDYFPGHHDLDAARALGSPHVFMNILTTSALVQRYRRSNGQARTAEFKAVKIKLGVPNYPGDTMTFAGEVSAIDAATGTVDVALKGVNSMGSHVIGTARVRLQRQG